MRDRDLRAQLDDRSERMNMKIRDAQLAKIPYMLIIGDKEVENSTVSVRLRNGEDLGSVKVSGFIERVESLVKSRELSKL
jgi:threonyl-tRNA synthetase